MKFDWKAVLKSVGSVVDAVIPMGVGNRTKIAVIGCPVLGLAATVVPFFPPALPFLPVVAMLQHALCVGAPAFALAGLARNL